MFEKLGILRTAQAMAIHAAERQTVLARNVANADTPGYRARDLKPFAEIYRPDDGGALRATRPGHFDAGASSSAPAATTALRPDAAQPNGNNVSLEQEIFAAADAKSQHDRALAIYRSALNVLRTSVSARG